jgi:hypothetical protein
MALNEGDAQILREMGAETVAEAVAKLPDWDKRKHLSTFEGGQFTPKQLMAWATFAESLRATWPSVTVAGNSIYREAALEEKQAAVAQNERWRRQREAREASEADLAARSA